MLVHPRLLTIDSAHWANLIQAAASPSSAMRDKAKAFPERLLEQGHVLTLSFHHLEELLSHERDDVVEARLHYLAGLPSIAWLRSRQPPHGLGAITDIMAAEAVAQCEGASDPGAVRDRAKASLIRFGPASEALGDLEQWWVLRPLLRASSRRARTVAAIAPVEFGHGSTRISDLVAGRFRTPDEAGFALAVMERALNKEIATRGDRRIEDSGRIAGDFFREVAELQPSGETDVWEFIVRTSEARGVRREEIRMDMTSDELGTLCVFRSQLAIIAEKTGHEFEALRQSVRMENCPHWLLQDALARHRQSELRRPGSDVNDGYLAAFAPYVDRLYVDKRKAENFRRALPKTPVLKGLLGEVYKAAHYWEIPGQLAGDA